MKKDVFITGLASFFPNSPVSNDEMEEFLGLISGKHSKVQRIVLKQNGIKRRYYALNKNQEITHTNAEMAMLAIRKLLALTNKSQKDIELLVLLRPLIRFCLLMRLWYMGFGKNLLKYSLLLEFVCLVCKL